MQECCVKLLDEILIFIDQRQKAYEANKRFEKSHSFKLLKKDLTEKYLYEWALSENE